MDVNDMFDASGELGRGSRGSLKLCSQLLLLPHTQIFLMLSHAAA
jgi:hypothetical protein